MTRILPLLEKQGNRKLLSAWLDRNTDYEVIQDDGDATDLLSVEFDLCLLDRTAFREHREALKTHRTQASPEFVPVLLLVPRKYANQLSADIWEYVDDIIWTSGSLQSDSLDTFELKGRIRSLVRQRSMSFTLMERQQRLRVLHRVLRHNLRNSMTVIRGRAELLGDPEDNEDIKTILSEADRLLGHTEKAQDIEDILEAGTRDSMSLDQQLEMIIEQFRREHPDAEFSLTTDHRVTVDAVVGISRAFEELIRNAIQHNPSASPTVDVTVSTEESFGVVTVSDTAPTIREQDRRVLRGDLNPTALNHGSGLGLWLVIWTVRRSDGKIEYQDRGSDGNSIRIQLPLAEKRAQTTTNHV